MGRRYCPLVGGTVCCDMMPLSYSFCRLFCQPHCNAVPWVLHPILLANRPVALVGLLWPCPVFDMVSYGPWGIAMPHFGSYDGNGRLPGSNARGPSLFSQSRGQEPVGNPWRSVQPVAPRAVSPGGWPGAWSSLSRPKLVGISFEVGGGVGESRGWDPPPS